MLSGWQFQYHTGPSVNLNQDVGVDSNPVFHSISVQSLSGANFFATTGSFTTLTIQNAIHFMSGAELNSVEANADTVYMDGHLNVSNLFAVDAISGQSSFGNILSPSIVIDGVNGNIYATGATGAAYFKDVFVSTGSLHIGTVVVLSSPDDLNLTINQKTTLPSLTVQKGMSAASGVYTGLLQAASGVFDVLSSAGIFTSPSGVFGTLSSAKCMASSGVFTNLYASSFTTSSGVFGALSTSAINSSSGVFTNLHSDVFSSPSGVIDTLSIGMGGIVALTGAVLIQPGMQFCNTKRWYTFEGLYTKTDAPLTLTITFYTGSFLATVDLLANSTLSTGSTSTSSLKAAGGGFSIATDTIQLADTLIITTSSASSGAIWSSASSLSSSSITVQTTSAPSIGETIPYKGNIEVNFGKCVSVSDNDGASIFFSY